MKRQQTPAERKLGRIDALWREIRQRRTFALRDLEVATGAPASTAEKFVSRLLAASIVEADASAKKIIYRLIDDRGVQAPRLNLDGTPLIRSNDRLWAALAPMRSCSSFELAAAAETSVAAAKQYLAALVRAGYVIPLGRRGGPHGGVMDYQLPRSRRTGPMAPSALESGSLWDPNIGQIVHAPLNRVAKRVRK